MAEILHGAIRCSRYPSPAPGFGVSSRIRPGRFRGDGNLSLFRCPSNRTGNCYIETRGGSRRTGVIARQYGKVAGINMPRSVTRGRGIESDLEQSSIPQTFQEKIMSGKQILTIIGAIVVGVLVMKLAFAIIGLLG